jgi:hypothetical protein
MQVGVERVPKAQVLVALLTAGVRDVSMQVGVAKQPEAMGFVRLTAGVGDASMQVDVERVLQAQLLIAGLMVAESDVSIQVGV